MLKKIEIMIMIMISYNVLQKRLISQKYKKMFSRKIRHVDIRSSFYTLDFYKVWRPNFYTKFHIYMNFRIIVTQFYINFSRQEHQIDVLYVSFNAWDSLVSFYTPFHFSFTVPLKGMFNFTKIPFFTKKRLKLSQSI